MNRRSNKILSSLVWGDKLDILELVEKYNVQERTIRTEIKELNEELERNGLPAIKVSSDGMLGFEEDKKVDVRACEKFIDGYTFYSYHMTKNERATILAMILLNARGYVTVEQLSETVGASRNTLLRDLQELKKWFEENSMTLVSQVRRGYIVDASEIETRRGVLKLLEINRENNDYETGYNLGAFWSLLNKQMDKIGAYEEIRSLVIEQEENFQMFLADYSFFETVLELTLVANRLKNGQILSEFHSETGYDLKSSSKYTFSTTLLDEVCVRYGLHASEGESLYLTDCLKGKSYLKDKNHKSKAMNVRLMIAETLYRISGCFGIDFYLDFALYDLLIAHMRSAVYRLQTGEALRNPLKDSLIEQYPDVFKIIKDNIGSLEEFVGGQFSDDELSFMVLYFASVIEKEKAESSKLNKVKVALVCETGRGTAQYMLARLRALDEMIEIVSVSSVHNASEIKKSNAQMIISTIPLDSPELPCVVVRSAMLDVDDLLDIQRTAFEVMNLDAEPVVEMNNSLEGEVRGAFYNLLSTERIEVEYEADDWQDAVREAGRLLYKTGAVEEAYIEAMVDNIKTHGPYVVIWPGTALPHAEIEMGVKKEAASIVRLKTPVKFNHETNDPVRYVIGISIESAASINQALYDVMMIFGVSKRKGMLDAANTLEEMLQVIKSFE